LITWHQILESGEAVAVQSYLMGSAHIGVTFALLCYRVILSSADDRWVWELNGEGIFNVKDARQFLDDFFLPKDPIATRWIKSIPIKVNIFAWKLHLDRLPTRVNLARRETSLLVVNLSLGGICLLVACWILSELAFLV
ncbi:hypothetical protein Tco_0356622, partial [Tanacetum coccineum]